MCYGAFLVALSVHDEGVCDLKGPYVVLVHLEDGIAKATLELQDVSRGHTD